MKTAVYPGSFDPVTLGHLDIIRRASGLFDRLLIGVLVNKNKMPCFSLEERMDMLKEATRDMPNVEIVSFEGLLADFCRMRRIDGIVRGVRGAVDFDYELPMAQINQKLNPEVQTLFLAASPEYAYISSSGVKELASFGGDYSFMVPEAVYERMNEKKVEGMG